MKNFKMTDNKMIIGGVLIYVVSQAVIAIVSETNLVKYNSILTSIISYLPGIVAFIIPLILTSIRPRKAWKWILTTSIGYLFYSLLLYFVILNPNDAGDLETKVFAPLWFPYLFLANLIVSCFGVALGILIGILYLKFNKLKKGGKYE